MSTQWAVWAGVVATCATLWALVAQLRALRRQTEAATVLDVHDKVFFGGQNDRIARRIEDRAEPVADRSPLLGNGLRAYDLDNYLGALDMVWLLTERKALSKKDAYHMFSYYAEAAWLDTDVRGYVERLRAATGDMTLYRPLEDFATWAGRYGVAENRRRFSRRPSLRQPPECSA